MARPLARIERPSSITVRIRSRNRTRQRAGYTRTLMQFLAQDLADVALGQRVAKLDGPRPLVTGQVVAAVSADRVLGQLRIAPYHEQLDDLAGVLVRHADRGGLEHAGHLADHVLDLVGEDLEARDDDHVL